jgi:hypothetical protein
LERDPGKALMARDRRVIYAAVGLFAETLRSMATWPCGAPKCRKTSLSVAKTGPASPRSLVQKCFERSKTPDL